jgi:hypothetical protein
MSYYKTYSMKDYVISLIDCCYIFQYDDRYSLYTIYIYVLYISYAYANSIYMG